MIVDNFIGKIMDASGLQCEPEAPSWAKWVDSVDMNLGTGYAFVGDFIPSGTVEIKAGTARVILACASERNKRMRSGYLRHFSVVKMDKQGQLSPTDIKTNDQVGGWALRIRGPVFDLLNSLETAQAPKGKFSAIEV